ncbi:MAG: hypothetical protein OSA98_21995, partial [Rubripirellula sp.]|nr:hypothetical protein [Rubripirellula sp.]
MEYPSFKLPSRRLLSCARPVLASRLSRFRLMVFVVVLSDFMIVQISAQVIEKSDANETQQSGIPWDEKNAPFYVEHCLSCHQGDGAE